MMNLKKEIATEGTKRRPSHELTRIKTNYTNKKRPLTQSYTEVKRSFTEFLRKEKK